MAKKSGGKAQSARERVQQQQAAQLQKDKGMKILFRSLIGVAVVVVVAVIAVIAFSGGNSSGDNPRNLADGGVTFGAVDGELTAARAPADGAEGEDAEVDGPTVADIVDGSVPHVTVFLDYQCPHCATFEASSMPFLKSQAEAGEITLEVRPVNLMDVGMPSNLFSSMAGNAAMCVIDQQPDVFLDVNDALFAQQTAGAQGRMDSRAIADTVRDAGADSSAVRSCITGENFVDFLDELTIATAQDPALAGPSGSFGTPTTLVNGERYPGAIETSGPLAAFIDSHR